MKDSVLSIAVFELVVRIFILHRHNILCFTYLLKTLLYILKGRYNFDKNNHIFLTFVFFIDFF